VAHASPVARQALAGLVLLLLALGPAAAAQAATKRFRPKLSAQVLDRTARKAGSRPRVRIVITKPVDDAGLTGTEIVFPRQLQPVVTLLQHVCTPAQLQARACPKSSQIGTAEAVTPLTKTPLKGPVYLANTGKPAPDAPGLELPYTVVFLKSGSLSLRLDGVLRLLPSGGLQSLFTGLPPTPLKRFTFTFFGGSHGKGGNFRAAFDLCSSRRGSLDVHLTSQDGVVRHSHVPLEVPACSRDPLVSASAFGLAGDRPQLFARVRPGPRGAKLSTVRFELPDGLRLRPGELAGNASAIADGHRVDAGRVTALSSRTVQVRGLGRHGAELVRLHLYGRALEVTSRLRERARRLRTSRLRKLNPLKLPAVVRTGQHDGRRAKVSLEVTGHD
jgi:hypothetical protein